MKPKLLPLPCAVCGGRGLHYPPGHEYAPMSTADMFAHIHAATVSVGDTLTPQEAVTIIEGLCANIRFTLNVIARAKGPALNGSYRSQAPTSTVKQPLKRGTRDKGGKRR